ncbi:SMP-30/gluconolactonase/LRE family protein [Paracoccus sp. YIM 132242]|uniref:SMP-30/gluconolactonase/LRE family protein n=1 Tax=Paracoccus lichenicola TaxID=2665644 RepID=A0A6L6HLE9_9RHOB|nr:SMP-30/gluconolactonase/LRE family protein [Paracoccus lichenicola]MTD99993.1 SMP-30/gluconolactonase/LRE family protein [Paracoccus lichenicola]
MIHDDRQCQLGEGAFWHPERRQFFWFDILGKRLLSQDNGAPVEWRLDRMASAAGWIDRDRLLVATETGLAVLSLGDGSLTDLAAVEADNPATRSNDGRADRQGGFWFSTMGRNGEAGLGAIYRFYRGEIRKLVEPITIPNSICFSPDGGTVHYSDTDRGIVWRQGLDTEGWPVGERQVYLDLSAQGWSPDGAVINADGGFCCAVWGQGAVMRFDADGNRTHHWTVGGRHSSCPAFGGPDLTQLLVTTALDGIDDPDEAQGKTYLLDTGVTGLPEPRVIL